MTTAALLKKKAKVKALTKLAIKHNGNQTAMAKELGVSRQAVADQLHDPIVQQSFIEIMNASGVDDKRLVKVLDEGLSATKFLDFGTREVTDHNNRHKYLETALKVKKLIAGDNATGPIQVNVAAFLVPEKKQLPQ